MPQLNEAGLDLIEHYEGLRLDAYKDPAGVWTIGYGHTAGVQPGQRITEDQAKVFLGQDLIAATETVKASVTVPLNEDQFSALTSFAFNVGSDQFKGSTLLKKLNQGDLAGAAQEFGRWVYADGRMLDGLVARRQAERELFQGTQGPLRLFAPPEQYQTFWTLQSDREHQLIAWIAGQLGLRFNQLNDKLFLGLPQPTGWTVQPQLQTTPIACGQACVAMACNALAGKHLTDPDINQRYGFSLLEALNQECSGYQWLDDGNLTSTNWPDIASVLAEPLPVILGLNGPDFSPSGRGHIILLTELRNDQVTFADPAHGQFRTTTVETILAAPPHPDGKFIFYPRRL